MKIKFEFDCEQDSEEFKIFMQAKEMHSALDEIANKLRAICKYGTFDKCFLTEREMALFEKFREEFFEILENEEVKL